MFVCGGESDLVRIDAIRKVTKEVLHKTGVPHEDTNIVAESIVYANLRGKHTHGIGRLPIYVRKIREGLMDSQTSISTVQDTKAVAVLDANHGFGQVVGSKGMDICIAKAAEFGLGIVGVRNSNNFGTAGFLGEIAVNKGMIGIVLGNSGPAIAPYGGKKPLLGTNPLCLAFPSNEDNPPIVLDMATTTVARGKIRLAAKNGERIPFGWAVDTNGNPTDCPFEALKGSLIPIGGHKGFGLSLAIDILAGLVTGAAFGGHVKPLNHPTDHSAYGHLIMAINVSFFMDYQEYEARIRELWNNVKACGDEGFVFMPGEKSYMTKVKNIEGVTLPETQIHEINQLGEELGTESRL